jgi:2-succinyl-6-hydroxy-2,4-cyclohexadiene-1-carboxylate synthase
VPSVVLLHGFTQSARSWEPVATKLRAEGHQVVALDAPGHGLGHGTAASDETAADLPTGADRMVTEAPHQAAWIGYSMGGRYCLYAALRHPDAISHLVLVSTTAGIDDPGERAARLASDDALATRIEQEGVEAFVDWWLQTPLFRTLPKENAAKDSRLVNTPAGLAASLRLAGAGTMDPPLWDRLHELTMPVLVVAGELDTRYSEIARRLQQAIGPNARLQLIEQAGHACHLERPDAFAQVVESFLAGPPDPH